MRGRAASWGAAVAVVAMLLAPTVASAQEPPPRDWNVNVTSDGGDGLCNATECTLREAIGVARPVDRVIVPAGTFVLSAGELVLVSDKIIGAGARSTFIDGNTSWRVMRITGAAATTPPPAAVTGVTIRRGNAFAGPNGPNGDGGGIFVQSASLQLIESHVVSNTATSDGGGIAVQGPHSIVLNRTTVAGNTVTGRSVTGGGIAVTGEASGIGLINSTITGNTATRNLASPSEGGGIYTGGIPKLAVWQSTIAGNVADLGAGIYMNGPDHADFASSMNNTLIVGNTPTACNQALTGVTTLHNLVQDSTCALGGATDIQGVNAPLLNLANNGGSTDTRALPAGSPAINAGGSCQTIDQREFARPANACDIGAFEYFAPRLTVTTTVINDSGGTATSLTYRVMRGGVDVAGSPAAANGTFTLDPGAYNVSSSLTGYTVTYGGDCSAAGAVTLGESQSKTCTVTANDNTIFGAQQLPPPVRGEKVNAIPARGTVKVKRPGARRFTTLEANGAQLEVGTIVDARKGRVRIVAASDDGDGTDEAVFYGGIFRIGQTKGRRPITTLTLTEAISCPTANNSAIAAAKKKKRRLWGDGKGRFRTKGKHSAATVVGTKWLVEDRCKSTLTRVVRGRVSVRDFAKKKTVIVKRGKRYIARAG